MVGYIGDGRLGLGLGLEGIGMLPGILRAGRKT